MLDKLIHSSKKVYYFRLKYVMGFLQKIASFTPWFSKEELTQYAVQLESLYAELLSGNSVLDIGCGPGNLSNLFCQRFEANFYVGIDYSFGMANDAKHEHPTHNFICGNTIHLPFKDNSFDIVHSARMFHHLQPHIRPRSILEQLRVAKKAVILEDLFGFEPGFWRWPHYAYYTLADGSHYRYTLKEWQSFFENLKLIVLKNFSTDDGMIHGRCAFWLISPNRKVKLSGSP
jgi:ubiquinone/menaquinone biosynthesis C-methylase UbiE